MMHSENSSKGLNTWLVGGTFDTRGGRPSGYFHKFSAAYVASRPADEPVTVLNGGSYFQLEQLVAALKEASTLFWFVDIPNDLPKVLPRIMEKCPQLMLVQSKNNRSEKYSREDLLGRMHASGAEWLVEFTEDRLTRKIKGSLLNAGGGVFQDATDDITTLAEAVSSGLSGARSLMQPLAGKGLRSAGEADVLLSVESVAGVRVPVLPHPGAFGFVRKNHIHEGVDLYCEPGTPVYAMEAGQVVFAGPFTGAAVASPWWNDTDCVLVEGSFGVLGYGEIAVAPGVRRGAWVRRGDLVGFVKTVLRTDKGRPRTMLHLERYRKGTRKPLVEWSLGTPQPRCLLSPQVLLLQAVVA